MQLSPTKNDDYVNELYDLDVPQKMVHFFYLLVI